MWGSQCWQLYGVCNYKFDLMSASQWMQFTNSQSTLCLCYWLAMCRSRSRKYCLLSYELHRVESGSLNSRISMIGTRNNSTSKCFSFLVEHFIFAFDSANQSSIFSVVPIICNIYWSIMWIYCQLMYWSSVVLMDFLASSTQIIMHLHTATVAIV